MTDHEPTEVPFAADSVIQGSGMPADIFPPGLPGDGEGLAALLGSDGGFDLGALVEQASNLQSQMAAAQDAVTSAEVEGVAGGGAVRITVSGGHEFRSVSIDPSAVDPDDVEMLQDLVLAALNDANQRIDELRESALPDSLGFGDLFGS